MSGPDTVTVWRKKACFLRVGACGGCSPGEGVPQKTLRDTRRDNLLICGRLLRCVMCGGVHVCARTRVTPCLFVPLGFTSAPPPPSSFTHRSFPCVSDPNSLCPSSSISSHTQRIKIRFFALISGSSPWRRFVLPPRSDER